MTSQMASLAFDAVVTTLTLFKAFRIRQDCGATSNPLIQTFLREGIISGPLTHLILQWLGSRQFI